MIRDVIVAAVAALIVNEVTDVSPWVAIRLVRWAAGHIYVAGTERAAQRKEEWEALIRKSIPTKLSKLLFGLGFGCAGLYCIAMRRVSAATAAAWRKTRESWDRGEIAGWSGMLAGIALWNSPSRAGLIAAGVLIAPVLGVIGIEWIFRQAKSAAGRGRLSKTTIEMTARLCHPGRLAALASHAAH